MLVKPSADRGFPQPVAVITENDAIALGQQIKGNGIFKHVRATDHPFAKGSHLHRVVPAKGREAAAENNVSAALISPPISPMRSASQ